MHLLTVDGSVVVTAPVVVACERAFYLVHLAE